jgi:hypothetical protein
MSLQTAVVDVCWKEYHIMINDVLVLYSSIYMILSRS